MENNSEQTTQIPIQPAATTVKQTTQQATPQTFQNSEQNPKSSFPKWVLVVFIVLLVIFSASAYFLGKSGSSKQVSEKTTQTEQKQATVSNSPIATSAPITNPDETANWKIYKHTEKLTDDFTLKYPNDWIENPSYTSSIGYEQCFSSANFKGEGQGGEGTAYFNIQEGIIGCVGLMGGGIYDGFQNDYINQACNKLGNVKGNGSRVKCDLEEINQHKIYKRDQDFYPTVNDKSEYHEFQITIDGFDSHLEGRFFYNPNNSNDLKLINKIISTVKFTKK